MSMATGIVLFVIGAILEFALNITVSWINIHLVGYILMIAGAVVFILGLIFSFRRRRTVTTSHTTMDPESRGQTTRRSTSAPNDEEF